MASETVSSWAEPASLLEQPFRAPAARLRAVAAQRYDFSCCALASLMRSHRKPADKQPHGTDKFRRAVSHATSPEQSLNTMAKGPSALPMARVRTCCSQSLQLGQNTSIGNALPQERTADRRSRVRAHIECAGTPTDHRMVKEKRFHDHLQDVDEIVVAANVSEFVCDQSFQFLCVRPTTTAAASKITGAAIRPRLALSASDDTARDVRRIPRAPQGSETMD